MSLTVKRSVNIQVTVTESFKKQYILLLNQLIEQVNLKLDDQASIDIDSIDNASFIEYLDVKMNELLFQREQLKLQLQSIQRCANGDSFLLSTLDAHQQVSEGDSLLSLITPAVIVVEDNSVSSIITH